MQGRHVYTSASSTFLVLPLPPPSPLSLSPSVTVSNLPTLEPVLQRTNGFETPTPARSVTFNQVVSQERAPRLPVGKERERERARLDRCCFLAGRGGGGGRVAGCTEGQLGEEG